MDWWGHSIPRETKCLLPQQEEQSIGWWNITRNQRSLTPGWGEWVSWAPCQLPPPYTDGQEAAGRQVTLAEQLGQKEWSLPWPRIHTELAFHCTGNISSSPFWSWVCVPYPDCCERGPPLSQGMWTFSSKATSLLSSSSSYSPSLAFFTEGETQNQVKTNKHPKLNQNGNNPWLLHWKLLPSVLVHIPPFALAGHEAEAVHCPRSSSGHIQTEQSAVPSHCATLVTNTLWSSCWMLQSRTCIFAISL